MLKTSTLELGGSDVFVVLDDANPAKAVEGGVFARLGNAGQIRTGAKRFIVQRGIADAFTQAFVGAMRGAAMGDPLDATTLLGPLASRVETGMVFINTSTTSRPELPFGGIKRSGYGRELGDVGLKEFVNRKPVVVANG